MWNQASLLEPASRKRSIGKQNAQDPCWWDPCFLLDLLIMRFIMNCVSFLMKCPFWVSFNHTHTLNIIDSSCHETFTSLSVLSTVFLNFELQSTANQQTCIFIPGWMMIASHELVFVLSPFHLRGEACFLRNMSCPSGMCFSKSICKGKARTIASFRCCYY